jgi:hypothetical protein
MASGATLCVFGPTDAEFPASNYPQITLRNNHACLAFDSTTGETCYFPGVLPRNYSGGGITVYVTDMSASSTSGTHGWLVAIERMTTDLDADSFASDQTITASSVSGTSGITTTRSVNISDGANMDSLAVGEAFRLRLTRDVANDTAASDAQVLCVEIKET